MENSTLRRYVSWVQRWHVLLTIVSVLVFFAGGYFSVLLFKNLRTDIEELLPESAPSVQDLKKAQGRVTGLNHLEVVIESSNLEAAKRFQLDLEKAMRALPPEVSSKVKAGIHEERGFFEKYKTLYVDLSDWEKIRSQVKKKAGKKAFDLGLGDDDDEKSFDLKEIEKKYKDRTSVFAKFRDDLFQSEDGKTRVILAFMPGKVTGMKANQALSDATKAIVAKLNPASYAPDLVVGLGGDVQNMVEEHHGLVHDLESSFIAVTVLCTLVLLIFYRSVAAVFWLTSALFVGVALTFGVSYFAVGYLNANTAFLGSIVIGNGINCGVILLARYQEERNLGCSTLDSWYVAIAGTLRPTLTAALAAGLAYGSLIATQFRGFNQFGVIGALGMVFCWVTAYVSLPAFLFFWERNRSIAVKANSFEFPLMPMVAKAVENYSKLILFVSAVLAVVVLVGAAKLSHNTVESDLSKLRNRESMEHGSGFWGKKVDDIFGRTLTPTMVLTESAADTKKVYEKVKAIHEREGANSPFSELDLVEDFLPKDQEQKLEIMKDLKSLLTPSVLAKLTAEERKWVRELLPDPLPQPLVARSLPPDLLIPFEESDGKLGTILHVYPRLNKAQANQEATGTWDGREVILYTQLLREAIKEAGVPAVIAGQPPVSADMLSAINRDGPKATGWAFLAVLLLVVVMFPQLKHSSSIILALLFGVLLMVGCMGYFGWKINFLNFITLPITFGIGVDYAVNVFGRYYEERKKKGLSIAKVIRSTGGAVLLCSATTMIGYGSLLFSGSQAFVSFGRLAVLGEIACIFAALFSMPALWHLLAKAGQKS